MQQFAIGYGPDAPDWQGMSGEEMFERAVANIERDVVWFGLAERFEESIFTMAALCGLEKVPSMAARRPQCRATPGRDVGAR